MPDFEEEIYKSKNGFFTSWNDLSSLSRKFHQIINLVLIGSKNKKLLLRYDDDQEIYERCNYVIVMFDRSYWEVFSKDRNLIKKLAAKFKSVKFLESDF